MNDKGIKSAKGEKSVKGKAAEAFEDLHVYQRARELTAAIYQLTRAREFATDRALVDQIRRAAVSVMSNLAEGFERGSKTEFIQFLFIAKGSCGEVRAQLQIAYDQHYLAGEEYNRLHNLARLTSGMLSNFIAHLQESEYQGEKFTRPQRQSFAAQQSRLAALKVAQETNMRSQAQRNNDESPRG